jgi:beta-glucosidase
VHRPACELKGFDKVELEPGESKTVTFLLNERSFAVWENGWKVPSGDYAICIGKNSHEMCLKKEVSIDMDEVTDSATLPKWPF